MKQPQHDFSAQTDLIATTSLPQVSLLEKSQPNLTLELTRGSPPGTPSRKKKKRNTANSNNCGNVFSMGVKWTMIMAQFRLMVIVRIANTGSIYTTLAYLAKMEMKRFAKIAQYYCKTHNPYKILRPKYVLKNVIITHM